MTPEEIKLSRRLTAKSGPIKRPSSQKTRFFGVLSERYGEACPPRDGAGRLWVRKGGKRLTLDLSDGATVGNLLEKVQERCTGVTLSSGGGDAEISYFANSGVPTKSTAMLDTDGNKCWELLQPLRREQQGSTRGEVVALALLDLKENP